MLATIGLPRRISTSSSQIWEPFALPTPKPIPSSTAWKSASERANRLQDFTFALQIGAERFLPKEWKDARIPIAFTRTVRDRIPIFAAQSDVNIEEAALMAYNSVMAAGGTQQEALDRADYVRRRARTHIAQTQWSILGFRFGIPTSFWLIRETLNRLVLGYAYTQELEQSPVYAERFRWQWDFTAQYSLPLPATLAQLSLGGWMQGIPLLETYSGWKINLLPQNISLSTRLSRYRRTEQSWFLPFPSPVERGFTATNSASLQWKFTEGGFLSPMLDYQLSQTNTLVPLELDPTGRQRTGAELARTMFFNDSRLINLGTPISVQQTTTFNFRPLLPNVGNLNRFLDISGSFSTTYMWNDPLQPDPRLPGCRQAGELHQHHPLECQSSLAGDEQCVVWHHAAATSPRAARYCCEAIVGAR